MRSKLILMNIKSEWLHTDHQGRAEVTVWKMSQGLESDPEKVETQNQQVREREGETYK